MVPRPIKLVGLGGSIEGVWSHSKTDRAATRIPPPGGLPAGSVSAGPAPPEATGKLPPASRLGSMVEMRSDANPEGAACLRIASCRLLLLPPHRGRVLPQSSRGPLDGAEARHRGKLRLRRETQVSVT